MARPKANWNLKSNIVLRFEHGTSHRQVESFKKRAKDLRRALRDPEKRRKHEEARKKRVQDYLDSIGETNEDGVKFRESN